MKQLVTLPDLGPQVEQAVVAKLLVKPGDRVQAEDPLLEIESGKAIVPIPAPIAGQVLRVHVSEGEILKSGAALLELEGEAKEPPKTAHMRRSPHSPAPCGVQGVRLSRGEMRAPSIWTVLGGSKKLEFEEGDESSLSIYAGPATRKLARELGLELSHIRGTAKNGRVSREDVLGYAQALMRFAKTREDGGGFGEARDLLGEAKRFGEVEVEPLSPIRRRIAMRIAAAWRDVPHVFHQHEIDISDLSVRLAERKKSGKPLSLTACLIAALSALLQEMPRFNATLDLKANRLLRRRSVHMGIAVDTKEGLLVPVLKNAATLSLDEIDAGLKSLADKARSRSLSRDELEGASFSISNLGSIGAGAFTPIIVPPQVAILGVARSRVSKQQRALLPVVLAYDHRVLDGADGARFLLRLEALLADPAAWFHS